MLGHSRREAARRPAHSAAPQAPAPDTSALAQRQAEIERDLLMARDIQQGLLLEAVPRLPGWEISAVSLPARELGGDLYDFLPLSGGRQGLMIGDVSGKGLPAALRMAVTRTVFRHEARHGRAPGETLAAVNGGVLSEIPQGMVTMLYATLDLHTGALWVANAGHNFPLLLGEQVREVELCGLPLGVDIDSTYEELCTTLQHGETVLFYTDGVVEATDANDVLFGFERLEQLLRLNTRLKPRALIALLLQELRAWSHSTQADDITMVAVRRRLAHAGAELRSIVHDVLGAERAGLWEELTHPSDDAPASAWLEVLPAIVQATQSRHGRGLARELSAQLRLALEEYR
jgi:sigma-B regulation protein RsbU (phosphoserine phosphatase)